MSEQDTHSLRRTSPKGQPFVGVCTKCGKEGLRPQAALEPCPNPAGISMNQALIGAIRNDDD